MKKLLKIYLQKPELAGIVLLALLVALFQFRTQMVFLSAENVRGILGVLPEVGLVAIGVTLRGARHVATEVPSFAVAPFAGVGVGVCPPRRAPGRAGALGQSFSTV